MKFLLSTAVVSGLLLTSSQAKAELKYSIYDAWIQRPISPPVATLPIDDEFVALAKAASANLFADVTQIEPQGVPPFADRQKGWLEHYPVTVERVIGDLRRLTSLSYDRSSQDTLVFWHRPDVRHLLDLVVAHHKALDAANPPADETATLVALQDYFEKNYGWKAKAETVADLNERARGIDAVIPLKSLSE